MADRDELRKQTRYKLAQVVDIANSIVDDMDVVPHARGLASLSLGQKEGEFIVVCDRPSKGFTVHYVDARTGQRYEINFHKR